MYYFPRPVGMALETVNLNRSIFMTIGAKVFVRFAVTCINTVLVRRDVAIDAAGKLVLFGADAV
jgi:hypothetical protein